MTAERSLLLWAAFLAMFALIIWSIFHERLLEQTIWTPAGQQRLLIYLGGYATWTLLLRLFPPVVFVRATALVAVLYAFVYCRSAAPAAVAGILFVSYVLGRCLLQPREPADDLIAVAAGLAALVFAVSFAVSIRINYWWTYLAVLILIVVVRHRDALAAGRRLRGLGALGTGLGRSERFLAELIGLLLVAHLLVVLKPEVSADGLGVHLVVPLRVQQYGLWDLDFKHVLWAVMPMGGDWAYTMACLLGGEMAARLINFAALLLVGGLLYATARKAAGRVISLLAAAIFLSSPIVQLVTGSLLVENIWTLFLVACVTAIVRLHESGAEQFALLAALLFGAALSTKFGTVAYAAPVLLLLWREMRAKRLAALGLLLVFGLPPYLAALAKTGNPIFPFLNNVFRSPYYTTQKPVVDERYTAGLHPDSLWQITFRTAKYLESNNGGFGFHFLLLVPVAILAYRRRWPFAAQAALLTGVIGFVFTFSAESYVRYLYPSLVLLLIGVAAAVERMDSALAKAVVTVSVALAGLNVYFLPASGGYHKGFYVADAFVPGDTRRYIAGAAPGRLLVEELNRRAPGEAAAFIESNQYAGLHASAYTDVWHHDAFRKRLLAATDGFGVLELMNGLGIHWIVAPCPGGTEPTGNVAVEQFLERYTMTVDRVGTYCLARLLTAYEGAAGNDRATVLEVLPDAVQRGWIDDFDSRVLFRGSWYHDGHFPQAFNSTLTYSGVPGAALHFRFKGAEVRYLYTKADNRGRAEVRIDGKVRRIIDLFSRRTRWQAVTAFGGLGPGDHELEVRVLTEKNPASSGRFVDLDAFVVP